MDCPHCGKCPTCGRQGYVQHWNWYYQTPYHYGLHTTTGTANVVGGSAEGIKIVPPPEPKENKG